MCARLSPCLIFRSAQTRYLVTLLMGLPPPPPDTFFTPLEATWPLPLLFILLRRGPVTLLAADAAILSQVPCEVGVVLASVPQDRGKGGI